MVEWERLTLKAVLPLIGQLTPSSLWQMGDNLAVYIPAFTQANRWILLYTVVFGLMTGLWCFISRGLVHHPEYGDRIRQFGRIALPFVLLGLGLEIISGVRALL